MPIVPVASQKVPGLSVLPDWLDAAECAVLLAAIDGEEWTSPLRRRVQHYGHRYDYGGRRVAAGGGEPAPPIPEWLTPHGVRLVEAGFMEREPDQVIVNEYLPGQGISAHVDNVAGFGPVVAAISLHSGCVMDFTEPATGTRVPVWLEPGGLCVMTGPARFDWRHAIAARKSDIGPGGRVARRRRVSVTFRTVRGVGGDG